MSLSLDNPVQPILPFPPAPSVWERYQTIADPAARWQIYLHQLGLAALLPWFQTEFGTPAHPWPTAPSPDIWHIVSGLRLTLGERSIVVILSETLDTTELQIPQEWIDIPDWAADYYIAAHINLDEQHLSLWGYTTHHQIKTQGCHDPDQRIYQLSEVDLVQDFSAFWVAQQLAQPASRATDTFPTVPPIQAENLLHRLAQAPDPRLEIPSSQWEALINDRRWRQQLYQQRQGLSPDPASANAPINLSRWGNQIFEQGWQTLETLFPQSPGLNFRRISASEAITTRCKAISLTTDLTQVDLVLVVNLSTEPDRRRNIRIQLYPSGTPLLPKDVTLVLTLADTGERLQTVQAGAQDNYIQLPPFRCPAEQPFRVMIQLFDGSVQEDFIS